MHKLTISKLELIQTGDYQLINEIEIGEIVGNTLLIQDLMVNPYFFNCWLEIGATHWELTEVFEKLVVEELPQNFYNKTNYHGGQ
jgi:hypothetical protein